MELRRLTAADVDVVLGAEGLFDEVPSRPWTEHFLSRQGHHLILAWIDAVLAGFVTGIEIAHPDKGLEMLLYELGVHPDHRRRGVGRALVTELASLARKAGCRGMWVPIDPDNDAAIATHASAGAAPPTAVSIMGWRFDESIDRPPTTDR